MRYVFSPVGLLCLGAVVLSACGGSDSSSNTIEWASSAAVKSEERPNELFGFRIGINDSASSEIQWLTDGELDDYKPAFSPDGSQIAFFRVFDYRGGAVYEWRSKLVVMSADGSDVHELTDSGALDHLPYWTRDGSNQITFNRWSGIVNNRIYRTSPDANPGDEQLISDPAFLELGYSSLRDGRVLVEREYPISYFLLTPHVGGTPVYEELSYPFAGAYLHRMTISPSETKVAYMKIDPMNLDPVHQDIYNPSVIAYADFDAANLRIENEVEITEYDYSTIDWYPSWDADEKHILYAHSGVIRAYDLETGITEQISSHDELDYRYPTGIGQTK
jgi:hypothetical protein